MQILKTLLFSFVPVPNIASGSGIPGSGPSFVEKAQIHEPAWYFIYLFILLGIYAWTSIYYGKVFVQTFQASINLKLTSRLFKSNNLLQTQLDRILYVFYVLSLAFMLYFLELRYEIRPYELQDVLLFLFNVALLALLFLGRMVLHNIAGFLFNQLKIVREYLYHIFLYNKLIGLVALPLMFLMVYTRGLLQELIIWTSYCILLAIFLLRLIRGLVFSYRKDVLNFYMFLYLCALEIAPIVLIYRWLEGIL